MFHFAFIQRCWPKSKLAHSLWSAKTFAFYYSRRLIWMSKANQKLIQNSYPTGRRNIYIYIYVFICIYRPSKIQIKIQLAKGLTNSVYKTKGIPSGTMGTEQLFPLAICECKGQSLCKSWDGIKLLLKIYSTDPLTQLESKLLLQCYTIKWFFFCFLIIKNRNFHRDHNLSISENLHMKHCCKFIGMPNDWHVCYWHIAIVIFEVFNVHIYIPFRIQLGLCVLRSIATCQMET